MRLLTNCEGQLVAVKDLVMHPDLGLAERTVVESHQKIELGQLEQEVATNQTAVDEATNELANATVEAEALIAAATKLKAAKGDLEDSKSNLERGQSLVAQQPDAGATEQPENGAGESTENPVAEPGQEF